MNLYLYIPSLSAHPYSCLKGLIIGKILRYWCRNNENDFIQVTSLFVQRLLARGHTLQNLTPILQQAASMIDNKNTKDTPTSKHTNTKNTLCIHWKYHPAGIKKETIRKIYNETLKKHNNFDKMVIAMSRPKNLRDLLCHTQLPDIKNNNVSDILSKIKPST
jgi:hypothetical protein